MINLNLPHRTVNIPNNPDEINIADFSKIITYYTTKYDLNIDRIIGLLTAISDMTVDEIEDIDFQSLTEIIENLKLLKLQDTSDFPLIQSIEIDGVKYGVSLKDGEFRLKLGQVKLLEQIINEKGINYLPSFASIIFRELDADGLVVGLMDKESMNRRAEIFNTKMYMDVLLPYINKLSEQYAFVKPE